MQFVIGIPYNGPDSFIGKILPRKIFPLQIFEVPENQNPRDVLEKKVNPQCVEDCIGQISDRAIAYRVNQKGFTVLSNLTKDILTKNERKKLKEITT